MSGRTVSSQRTDLVGNRLALGGAILYLSEWVAIIALTTPGPFGPGTSPAAVVSGYAKHADGAALSAGWFSLVLIGRVLFLVGVRASLRERPKVLPWLDFAVAAMTVSVALEVMTYGVAAAAARLAADGAAAGQVVALDTASYWLNLLVFGPIAVSVLAAGVAMVRSRLFPAWIGWLACVAGAAGIGAELLLGTLSRDWGPGLNDAVTSVLAIGMWVWMIATGIVLWRHRPAQSAADLEPATG